MKLKGKVAAITGGNSGIGEAIAKRFSEEGALVAIMGRNSKTLEKVKEELGENSLAFQGDVSKISDLEAFFKKVHEAFGGIDCLLINAGISNGGPTEEVTEEVYDSVMDTNVKGAYFTVQKALPYLNEGAAITATSSVAGLLGIKYHGIYGASKAALNRLMIAFSTEFLESKKWRFNLISPGYIETPIFDKRLQENPTFKTDSAKIVPVKRFGKPSEIASAALFLSSDEAKYICGANLVVDGGVSPIFPLHEVKEYHATKSNL